MFTITNGFTYVAFLMFIAGGLLALEKYAKWKVFNWVPPLVFIYVLNMVFCTIGMFNNEACPNTYSALKNNLLYAMIFVMLLRCDFRKLAKLGARMIAIFLGCYRCSVCFLGWRFRQHGRYAGRSARRRGCLRLRSGSGHRLLLPVDRSAAVRSEVCSQVEQGCQG